MDIQSKVAIYVIKAHAHTFCILYSSNHEFVEKIEPKTHFGTGENPYCSKCANAVMRLRAECFYKK